MYYGLTKQDIQIVAQSINYFYKKTDKNGVKYVHQLGFLFMMLFKP